MLGAVVSLVLVVAAAFAVTRVGGVITLLFIAAVLFLAYRRLSLLAFTVTFTVLLAAYTVLGASSAPAGVWKGFLWLLLAALWLLNVRPLRKALITRPFMKTYLKLLPADVADRAGGAGGRHGVVGRRAVHRRAATGTKLLAAKPPQLSAEEQAFLDGPCEELCRMLDDWDITHERGDLPPEVWEFLKNARLLRHDHPEEVRRPGVLRLRALVRAGEDRQPQRHRLVHRRGAQLARARRSC